MSAIAWRSPFHAQRNGGKAFGVAFNQSRQPVSPLILLDWVIGAMMEIDGGTLWNSNRSPFTPPGAAPEVKQLQFNARYQDGGMSGSVNLTAISGPSSEDDSVGLELVYTNQPDTFGPPWGYLPERIIAVTTMHAGDYFQRVLSAPWPNPIENWVWTAGAWAMAEQQVEYQGWLVSLVQ